MFMINPIQLSEMFRVQICHMNSYENSAYMIKAYSLRYKLYDVRV